MLWKNPKMTETNNLAFDHAALEDLSRTHGASFFVLSGTRFTDNFKSLHQAFSKHYDDVNIGYSYKTNYTPQLCRIVHSLGGFAEVVSEMEYNLAKRLGVPGERIIFNGPYKSRAAFEDAALTGATLNLDSHRDLEILTAVATANPKTQIGIVLRCNFALETNGDISRFGMDTESPEFPTVISQITALPNVTLKGLHCHFPDRDLDSFRARARRMVELVKRIFPNSAPEILNIGGGYFSKMPDSLRTRFTVPPATFEDYGKAVGQIFSAAFKGQKPPALFLEPGTALVADTQSFYTRVISIKTIRGKNFATVAGSSFDISPTARSRVLPVTAIRQSNTGQEKPEERLFDIVGYTCIEKDILSENLLAPLRTGDYLRYDNVGSYSVVMRPPFILPANPVLFEQNHGSTLELIKKRQTTDDVFANFIF